MTWFGPPIQCSPAVPGTAGPCVGAAPAGLSGEAHPAGSALVSTRRGVDR